MSTALRMLMLLLLASCGGPPAEPVPYGAVEVLGRHGFVVRPSTLVSPREEHWQPTRSDLEGFERGLVPFVRSIPPGELFMIHPDVDLATRLDGYTRQYLGVVRDGRRLLRVSLFCDPLPAGIVPTSMIEWSDGGECICEALYDPESGALLDFDTGGDA